MNSTKKAINGSALEKCIKEKNLSKKKISEAAGFSRSYIRMCQNRGLIDEKMVLYLEFLGIHYSDYNNEISCEYPMKIRKKDNHKPTILIDSNKLEKLCSDKFGPNYIVITSNWLGIEKRLFMRHLREKCIGRKDVEMLESLGIFYEDYKLDDDLEKAKADVAYSFEEAVLLALNDISERLSRLENMLK